MVVVGGEKIYFEDFPGSVNVDSREEVLPCALRASWDPQTTRKVCFKLYAEEGCQEEKCVFMLGNQVRENLSDVRGEF